MSYFPDRRPVIEMRALTKTYGWMLALRGLTLAIPRGQFVALLGPNGSGKSTLMRLLTGNSLPTSGEIFIGGWRLPQEAAQVRGYIGVVSHKALLYEQLTARENLRFFASLYGLPRGAIEARIEALLAQVGLSKRADHLARTFSRGMQQRLSIARALLHDPQVLLFDEPYTGLDQDASVRLDGLLEAAKNGTRTILMATHQLDRAARLADRVVILSRGTAVYDAPTAGLDHARLAADYAAVTGLEVER